MGWPWRRRRRWYGWAPPERIPDGDTVLAPGQHRWADLLAGSAAPDGGTMRRARERARVPLRHIAAGSGLSHGYLSKVERGEPGRPVTHRVLAAYRQAGVVPPGVAVGVCPVATVGRRVGSAPLLTQAAAWRTWNNEPVLGDRPVPVLERPRAAAGGAR